MSYTDSKGAPKNLKLAVLAWFIPTVGLLFYEAVALYFHWVTLSRAIWTLELTPYGSLLPLLLGILCGHLFSPSLKVFAAFQTGVLSGAIFWHIVGPATTLRVLALLKLGNN